MILDLTLADGDGLAWVGEARRSHPGTALIVATGKADVPVAVEAMRRGADHFLTKSVNLRDLEVFLRKGLETSGLRRASESQKALARRTRSFLGDSEAMKPVRELAALAAENDSTVLLHGEAGVGKGVLARFIHDQSRRAGRAFAELSCAALRGDRIASEMFGQDHGAFTSAVSDRQGLLDIADGGTLFLDEIGELDLEVQVRFLKVLEERRYQRLGEVRERRSEFRLISATNRDLAREVQRGRFRADLHYRVNVLPISIPPLRARASDIPGRVAALLEIEPSLLTLELTESICASDLSVAGDLLRQLKEVGVSVSIDDFGTGYSSLSYVKKLPLDNIKIDMSFVKDVTSDPDAASIVSAITAMARALGLKTIAEGVENGEQRNVLRLLRCDMGQGFLFSPPLAAAAFEALVS